MKTLKADISGSIDPSGGELQGDLNTTVDSVEFTPPEAPSIGGADLSTDLPSADASLKAPGVEDASGDSSITAALATAGAATVGALGLGGLLGKGDDKSDAEVFYGCADFRKDVDVATFVAASEEMTVTNERIDCCVRDTCCV